MTDCPHCGQKMPPRPPRIIRKSFKRVTNGMNVDFGGTAGFRQVTGYSRIDDRVLLSDGRGNQIAGKPSQFVRVQR